MGWFEDNDPDTATVTAETPATPPPAKPAGNNMARAGAQTVGGIVGSSLATPLAAIPGVGLAARPAGAALGGMGAEAMFQQLSNAFQGLPPIGMGGPVNLGEIGRAGATQGAYEAGGRLIGGTVSKAVAPFSKKVASQLSARTEDVVRAADRSGIMVDATRMANEALGPLTPRAGAAGGSQAKALTDFIQNFLGNKASISNPVTGTTSQVMTASEAHLAKEFYDNMAKAVRVAEKAGQFVGPAEKVAAQYAKRLADRLRSELVTVVPKYGKALSAEAKNIRTREAMQPLARSIGAVTAAATLQNAPGIKDLPWYFRFGIPGAAGGLAADPRLLAFMAELLLKNAPQTAMRQAPRAVGTAVQAFPPDTTEVSR